MTATHTPTPWTIRPNRFDDWGYIRGADGEIACISRGQSDKSFDAHRSDKTDPYEPNAVLIVEAVNSYASLKARIAELEANEKAYEEIIGKKTYREVADELAATPQISPETETVREEMQECGTVEAFEEADFAILYREINESGTTTLQEITNVPQVFCQEIARQLRGHAPTPAVPSREQIAKAIYAGWLDADHCTENHFQWFDAGKDNPDSCVHYSNVAKALKVADRILALSVSSTLGNSK